MNLFIPALIACLMLLRTPESDTTDKGQFPDQGQKPLFTFGILADVQYCDCEPAGSRYYKLSLNRLREALGSFKSDSVSFVINLGDIIDRDFDSYKPVLSILDSSALKVYHLTGNHDYSVGDRYKKRLPLPFPDKEKYYSFIHEGIRFIALDGNELSIYSSTGKAAREKAEAYLSELRDSGAVNAMDWNGGIGSGQLKWLKSQLDDAALKKENVFILCHFPVFPVNPHNLLNYSEVNSLLSGYKNIIAWFNGHNHAGNYGNFNSIHFVTLRGMVETKSTTSFAIVEVYRNKIWIKGAGREKSQILAY